MWRMNSKIGQWKLAQLAGRAGLTPRTVRYYVQRGLLPPPVFRGVDTTYNEDHLLRLKAIRRLQARFLPLDAIQVELERLNPEAIRALAEGGNAPPLTSAPPMARGENRTGDRNASAPDSTKAAAHDAPAWERWQLAPGLELHVSQAADARSRALADELRDIAKHSRAGEKSK
jgi:DNA-binding transcriptional MerR regulator